MGALLATIGLMLLAPSLARVAFLFGPAEYFALYLLAFCTLGGMASNNQAKGLFGKRDFIYIAKDDEYECPAGERLIYRFTRDEAKKTIHRYWSSACPRCSMKSRCTTGKYRRVSRWEHEVVLEEMEDRVDRMPDCMRIRGSTVEHPFGTIKSWLGPTHFQMKTLKHVSTEMSLHVLAYNLKRMMQMFGAVPLMEAMRA